MSDLQNIIIKGNTKSFQHEKNVLCFTRVFQGAPTGPWVAARIHHTKSVNFQLSPTTTSLKGPIKKDFENIVRKRENTAGKPFLRSLQCFLFYKRQKILRILNLQKP